MSIDKIFKKAKKCKRCYDDKEISVPLPDPKNGKKNVKIMFINERPGRIGTGESGLISYENNDPSARNFKELFRELNNITRKDIFITNACLCHPIYDEYRDKAPTVREIKNCNYWLGEQIKETNPKLIIPLGKIALKSIKEFYSDSKELKDFDLGKDIGKTIKVANRQIYPLYHTSQLVRNSKIRTGKQQREDWKKIERIL